MDQSHTAADESRKPNIIVILADDLGYNDLGCYGQKEIQTPNIDRLAAESTRFTQCYTGAPICAPSRSVLMTGQHSGHTRIRDNFARTGGVLVLDNGSPQRRVPLEPEDVTIAEVLKEAGYVTGMTGKWGLGEPGTTGVPNKKGFDEWFGYINQRRAHTYYPPYLWHNEEKVILEGNQDGRREQYSHDMFADFALDFIRKHKDRPFFLYLPWCLPHGQYEIPSIGSYADKPWSDDEKVYAAMVTRLDRDVGRVMELLKELDIEDDTILFLSSDHGAARRWEGTFDSCGPLRGTKGDLYEGGIRTPMIAHWRGRIPANAVSDQVWNYADFLPTIAELARVEPPSNIDGVSVLPTLLGEEQNLQDRFLYWEFFRRGRLMQAVRVGDWKGMRLAPTEPLALYDLSRDIGEQRNVATAHPEVIEKIEAYLQTARTESKNWPTRED
ncbi:arylsulfatase [Candidatus Poribacteria bacterium]|nr:arylsulfatase [Candidatus Poribacteria bacterium]